MRDIHFEQIVVKKNTLKDIIINCIIIFVSVILSVILIMASLLPGAATYTFLFLAGVIYLAYRAITARSLEFEYIFTNDEIDIDKISAKRKRFRIANIKLDKIETFEKYEVEKYKSVRYDKRINAAINPSEDTSFCAVYKNKNGESILLIFSPNERMQQEINKNVKKRARFYGGNRD